MNEHIFHLIDLQELTRIFSLLKKMLTKSSISYQSPRIYPKNQIAKKERRNTRIPTSSILFHLFMPTYFFFIKPRPARDTTRSISMQTICSAPDSAHYGVQ